MRCSAVIRSTSGADRGWSEGWSSNLSHTDSLSQSLTHSHPLTVAFICKGSFRHSCDRISVCSLVLLGGKVNSFFCTLKSSQLMLFLNDCVRCGFRMNQLLIKTFELLLLDVTFSWWSVKIIQLCSLKSQKYCYWSLLVYRCSSTGFQLLLLLPSCLPPSRHLFYFLCRGLSSQ